VLHAIVDQVLTETVVKAIVQRVLTKLAPTAVSRSVTDLRAAIGGRERIQGQRIDRAVLEAGVRGRVDDWRGLLNRRPAYGRQLLGEMLAGPITFTPTGRVYRFRGERRSVR